MMIRKIFTIIVFSFFYYIYTFILSIAIASTDNAYDNSNLLKMNKSFYEEDNQYRQIERKKKDKEIRLYKTYYLPEENQIFGKKKHLISIFGGYGGKQNDLVNWINSKTYHGIQIYSRSGNEINNPGDGYNDAWRESIYGGISYSIPLKLYFINGRLTLGLFSLYMQQNILRNDYVDAIIPAKGSNMAVFFADENDCDKSTVNGIFNTYTIGLESMYELIFGHKNLYLTCGVGVSYLFVLSQNAKTDNENFNELWEYRSPKILWNNSRFNWVIKASIGHKFDCGLIIEANWKHYSNGELSTYNWGFNFFGGTIGFVF